MSDIWETRVCSPHGVIHGCATLFTAWHRNADRRWQMLGSFWAKSHAEKAIASASELAVRR